MDRLTQLQDAIDQMTTLFVNSVSYVHEKAPLAALNSRIPVVFDRSSADPSIPSSEVFKQSIQELASDITKKAQEIDALIDALPGLAVTEEEQLYKLEQLEAANKAANEEYEKVIAEAQSMLEQVTQAMRTVTDDQSKAFVAG